MSGDVETGGGGASTGDGVDTAAPHALHSGSADEPRRDAGEEPARNCGEITRGDCSSDSAGEPLVNDGLEEPVACSILPESS